jgi:hypothetical protein
VRPRWWTSYLTVILNEWDSGDGPVILLLYPMNETVVMDQLSYCYIQWMRSRWWTSDLTVISNEWDRSDGPVILLLYPMSETVVMDQLSYCYIQWVRQRWSTSDLTVIFNEWDRGGGSVGQSIRPDDRGDGPVILLLYSMSETAVMDQLSYCYIQWERPQWWTSYLNVILCVSR